MDNHISSTDIRLHAKAYFTGKLDLDPIEGCLSTKYEDALWNALIAALLSACNNKQEGAKKSLVRIIQTIFPQASQEDMWCYRHPEDDRDAANLAAFSKALDAGNAAQALSIVKDARQRIQAKSALEEAIAHFLQLIHATDLPQTVRGCNERSVEVAEAWSQICRIDRKKADELLPEYQEYLQRATDNLHKKVLPACNYIVREEDCLDSLTEKDAYEAAIDLAIENEGYSRF